MYKIGENLKRIRIEKNVTQVELAEQINSTQSAISFIETGTANPSVETLFKIANVLGCSLDELAGRNFNRKK